MLRFIDLERATPDKRGAKKRAHDFHEIYLPFDKDSARAQASRCSQCGVPFCQNHCPLTNDIPDWLRLTAEGRLEEAYDLSAATNSMPEICGRICPQDRLCEGSCVIEQSGHGTVTIGAVEQFLTETAFDNGWVKEIEAGSSHGVCVGIIGAGPAGLAAAEELRKAGVGVVIYDRYDRAGGLLVYGIPSFKLEKDIVARRIERLQRAGVEFRNNVDVGRDISFAELKEKHDAVLIATGVYKTRELEIAGADTSVPALSFLVASNRIGLGAAAPEFDQGALNAAGKRVVVIGGGDTAMDCVRTAIRQGAKSVTCLYRRDRANMPGSAREVANAIEEGVAFEWLAAPRAIEVASGETVRVLAQRMKLGAADASGRQGIEEIPGSEFSIDADMAIAALGFEPEDLPRLFGEEALGVTRRGTLRLRPGSFETMADRIYGAGDIVRGASLVVWAIHDGREAAAEIIDNLLASPARLAAE